MAVPNTFDAIGHCTTLCIYPHTTKPRESRHKEIDSSLGQRRDQVSCPERKHPRIDLNFSEEFSTTAKYPIVSFQMPLNIPCTYYCHGKLLSWLQALSTSPHAVLRMPLHGRVISVFRPAYTATCISLVFWSCIFITLIIHTCKWLTPLAALITDLCQTVQRRHLMVSKRRSLTSLLRGCQL